MAKNLHVKVGNVDIAKRNLAKVTYPNTSTSLSKINRKIGSRANKEYWRKQSDTVTLTAKGQPGYFNSGQGESDNINSRPWREKTSTVPSGYTKMYITAFTPAGTYGATQTQLVIGGSTKKDTGTRYDFNNVTSWVGSTITVSGGQTINFRVRGARDINRDSQTTDISGTLSFYFE